MGLASVVIDFVQRVGSAPKLATDPGELAALVNAARRSWDGAFGARNAPIAPMTWEQQVLLPGAAIVSERVAFRFPYAMEIVGLYASVVPLLPAAGGAAVPTLDDLQVQLDLNNTNQLTTLEGVSTAAPGAARGGTFVTLGALHINPSRLLGLKLRSPNPEVGATFRWKQGGGPIAPVYRDSLVALAMFVRRLDDERGNTSANVPSMASGL